MLNRCEFIGRLGADPEQRQLQNGGSVVNMRLAVTDSWRDKQTGERKERTEWVPVVIWNEKIAELVMKYLKKGSRCFIAGEMQTRKWIDQSGQDKFTTEIVLQRFRGEFLLLDDRKDGQRGGGASTPPQESPGGYNDLDDEIPF